MAAVPGYGDLAARFDLSGSGVGITLLVLALQIMLSMSGRDVPLFVEHCEAVATAIDVKLR